MGVTGRQKLAGKFSDGDLPTGAWQHVIAAENTQQHGNLLGRRQYGDARRNDVGPADRFPNAGYAVFDASDELDDGMAKRPTVWTGDGADGRHSAPTGGACIGVLAAKIAGDKR